jgi:hypothetical protein
MLVSRAAASTRGPRRSLPACRSAALLAAFAAGALALAGCQANPAPPPLASASTSPKPSPSPATAAPTLPAEAQGTSKAAAKAFVRHWIDVLNYAMSTGDTAGLVELADRSCSTCEAIADRIEDVYAGGGHLEGTGWRIRTLSYLEGENSKSPLVSAGIEIAPQAAYASAEATPSQSPRSRGHLDFSLDWRPTGWKVLRLEATQ